MIYRPVPGYDDLYAGMDATIIHGERGELKQNVYAGKGYRYVSVPNQTKKGNTKAVHELVAAAFLGPRPKGMHVRHADGTKDNNHVSNLCYGTNSDNQKDSVRHGTHRNTSKTSCTQGHEYTPENTYEYPAGSGHRQCRKCRAIRNRNGLAAKVRGRHITAQEKGIIYELSPSDLSNRQIARIAGVSLQTVARHRRNLQQRRTSMKDAG